MTMKYVLSALLLLTLVTGCKKKKDTTCVIQAGNTVAPAAEETLVTTYLSSNAITNAVELENSGMYYSIETAGNSKRSSQCNTIVVKYVGKLVNGNIFDQTPGTNTRSLQLGGLIEGWRRSLPLIGEGGKMKLYIPPALGYGAAGLIDRSTGQVIIPPNQIIVFDMELVAINQ